MNKSIVSLLILVVTLTGCAGGGGGSSLPAVPAQAPISSGINRGPTDVIGGVSFSADIFVDSLSTQSIRPTPAPTAAPAANVPASVQISGTLRGTIYASNRPYSGGFVLIFPYTDWSLPYYYAFTGSDGTFALGPVQSGAYAIAVNGSVLLASSVNQH